MRKLLYIALPCLALPLIALTAANSISSSYASISEPLTESEITKIKSSEKWPQEYTLRLTKVGNEGLNSLNQIPGLEILEIKGDVNITDIGSISSLKNLRVLSISGLKSAETKPLDVSPIAQCQELEELKIYDTPVVNLQNLSALTGLKELNLYYTPIDSLEFLRNLTELESLNIGGREHTFESYEPIAGQQKLRSLGLRSNPQANDESLACLSALKELREITLSYTVITTVDFLKNCRELEQINCERIKTLRDIDALADMPFLRSATFSGCPIDDITSLARKPFLEDLNLIDTKVSDVESLSESMYLVRLHLAETNLTDLSPLAKMQCLEYLNFNESKADITTLPLLRKLRDIRLNETATRSLNPLVQQPSLRTIEIRDTPVTELSPLLQTRNLSTISLSKSIGEKTIASLESARPRLTIKTH